MTEETLSDGSTLIIDPDGKYGVEFECRAQDGTTVKGEVWLGRINVADGAELALEALAKIIDATAGTRHAIPIPRYG